MSAHLKPQSEHFELDTNGFPRNGFASAGIYWRPAAAHRGPLLHFTLCRRGQQIQSYLRERRHVTPCRAGRRQHLSQTPFLPSQSHGWEEKVSSGHTGGQGGYCKQAPKYIYIRILPNRSVLLVECAPTMRHIARHCDCELLDRLPTYGQY